MGRPRKYPLATQSDAAQVEFVAVESPQVVEAAPVSDAAPAAVVVEKPRAGLYRVTRGVFFNQLGASQWLAVGTLIDESVVGAAHITELKRHRIPLEEV
jgi:hypothetical protein